MLLQAYGYSVGHEQLLDDGISSWMQAVDTPEVPFGTARDGTDYTHVIHVVRHPVHTIASMSGGILLQGDPAALTFMRQFITVHKSTAINMAVQTYVRWNTLITRMQPVLRLKAETARTVLPAWLAAHDLPAKRVTALPARNYNSRLHHRLRWIEISHAVKDRALYARLKKMAVSYGYGPKATRA